MRYSFLGTTGVRVSALAFGTMPFGGAVDEPTAAALFARCRDAGINHFDSADVYNDGRAELEFDVETRARISALTPEPPPATDRNEERTTDNYGTR
jgi:predicted aldo/keto reductase-like oxidoreductase